MVSKVILYIMVFFMSLGAIDKAFLNNEYGYGEKFEEGINAMGPLTLSMVGIMCLAPVLGQELTPVVAPVYNTFGADPAMFAGTILAIDMGGYPLAKVMTENSDIVILSGIILGSMMGGTIVFAIPVSLSIVDKEDFLYLAKGMMIGVISIPLGSFVGGVVAGIPVLVVFVNLIPVFIIALMLAVGLIRIPDVLLKGFSIFSKIITIVIIVGLASAIIEALTGIVIIPGMDPIGPQLEIIGIIGITLAGAYPFVYFITTKLSKPLSNIGKLLSVNEVAVGGIIAALANSIPTFGMVKDMDPRGKVIAIAFSVPAVAALGDQLGYTSANCPEVILPMIVGKIVAGIIAIIFAMAFLKIENIRLMHK